jgi:hypothetical protein
MLIFWIRKNKSGEQSGTPKNEKGSFQKHDEDMKRFCGVHPKLETSGARDMMKVNGDILATVQRVKLNKHIHN